MTSLRKQRYEYNGPIYIIYQTQVTPINDGMSQVKTWRVTLKPRF